MIRQILHYRSLCSLALLLGLTSRKVEVHAGSQTERSRSMKTRLQNPKSEWRSPKEVRRPHAMVRALEFVIHLSFVIFYSSIAFARRFLA